MIATLATHPWISPFARIALWVEIRETIKAGNPLDVAVITAGAVARMCDDRVGLWGEPLDIPRALVEAIVSECDIPARYAEIFAIPNKRRQYDAAIAARAV